jgi:hypothetical protein
MNKAWMIASGIALAPMAATANAQQGSPAGGEGAGLAPLYACMSVAAVDARVACFDKAAADLKAGEAAGRVTVLTPKAIEQAQVATFGAADAGVSAVTSAVRATSTPGATAIPRPAELNRVTLAVTAIEPAPGGNRRFVMENGQVWRQTDGLAIPRVGQGPWTAEIRKAAVGSFLLKLDGKTAVRVQREK